jgi:hypothetical protein
MESAVTGQTNPTRPSRTGLSREWVSLISTGLQIFRCEAGIPRYFPQGNRTYFIGLMPSPRVIAIAIMLQLDMRGARCFHFRCPSDSKQCLINAFCFAARPLTHKKVIDLGGFLRCSVRSASTRRARATAATSASRLVAPYAITPGRSEISASQRPSSSCSKSTLNDSESGGC